MSDRYDVVESIKTIERKRRSTGKHCFVTKIHKSNEHVPNQWDTFMVIAENKAELADFISKYIVDNRATLSTETQIYIGGCEKEDGETCMYIHNGEAESINRLRSNHEEADTRILLHAKDALNDGFSHVIVHSPDTDVLILCISKSI